MADAATPAASPQGFRNRSRRRPGRDRRFVAEHGVDRHHPHGVRPSMRGGLQGQEQPAQLRVADRDRGAKREDHAHSATVRNRYGLVNAARICCSSSCGKFEWIRWTYREAPPNASSTRLRSPPSATRNRAELPLMISARIRSIAWSSKLARAREAANSAVSDPPDSTSPSRVQNFPPSAPSWDRPLKGAICGLLLASPHSSTAPSTTRPAPSTTNVSSLAAAPEAPPGESNFHTITFAI